MPTDIYEMHAKSYRGAAAMAHLVAIGAHDGHGRMGNFDLRKVKPSSLSQGKSWFNPESDWEYEGGYPLVGQVFFPLGDTSLDSTSDRIVLDAVSAFYLCQLQQKRNVGLEFVGHADPRGAANFNHQLGLKRAKTAQGFVDKRIKSAKDVPGRLVFYNSATSSMGESATTGNYMVDRRVDIVLRSSKGRVVDMDQKVVTGDYNGPLTNKIQVRSWGGGSIGVEVINGDFVEIELRNPKTGRSAFYTYTGASIGVSLIPVSVALPQSGFTDYDVPFGLVDVDDFEGPGSVSSATAVGSVQCYIFTGPKLHKSTKILKTSGFEFCTAGQAGVFELPAASSGAGKWRRMPYNSVAERSAHIAERWKSIEERGIPGGRDY